MGIPAIRLSEKTRKRLGLICAVANFCCIIPSLVLFALGGYMQASVQDKVDLIQGYGGHYLPPMIICLGLIYVVINLAGGKICLDNTKHRKRKKLRVVFAAYIYVSSVMCFIVMLTAIFCFAQIANLHHAFHDGISSAMKKYRFSAHMKETIDKLQIEFRCCGNTGYSDWFSTPWIDEQYLAVDAEGVESKMSSGHYLSDDTPFSCCDVTAIRPCIHHRVLANSHHYNYKYTEEVTLYKSGCKQVLMDVYGGQLLTNVGIMILVISLIQIGVVVCARFLQTSSLRALKKGNSKDSAKGWLIPWPKSLKRRRSRKEAEEIELVENKEDPEDDSEDDSDTGGGTGYVLKDQSYSTHGLSGPAAPPPLPPSFGSAFNKTNNHSNINFSNRRRFPVAPPPPSVLTPPTPPRIPPPPPPSTPPRLNPPPLLQQSSPNWRLRSRHGHSPRRLSSSQMKNWRQENIPYRRQSTRSSYKSTPTIPIYQNGFYRNNGFQ